MVTRILFDPRRDLTDGTTSSSPVTLEATPTGVREDGSIVVLPTTLSFTVNTAADVVQLAPPAASWAWRIVARQDGVVKQQRTVRFADIASIQYQKLTDVDPASLGETQGHQRQWDATFWQLMSLLGTFSGKLDAITAGAPGALDSFFEVATQMGLDEATVATLQGLVAGKEPAGLSDTTRASLGATFVTFGPTAPDPAKATVWIDTSALPQVVRGYNGSTWVAIGGATGSSLLATLATVTTAAALTVGNIQPYNATAGALAPALPALSTLAAGTTLLGVQKAVADTSSNAITVTAAGSDTFDSGATTLTLKGSGELRQLQVVSIGGTKYWKVIGGNTPLSYFDATYVARGNRVIDMNQAPYNCVPGTDVTAKLQAAVNAIAALGGGDIFFSVVGTYYLDGAAQTGTALGYAYNGQILFPATQWDGYPNTPIRIRGPITASSGAPSTGQANGLILQSRVAGTYMFDCVPYSSKFGYEWTGVMPIFENLILRVPVGGTSGGVNALVTQRARFERVTVDTGVNPGSAPTGTFTGIVGPHGFSNGDVTYRDVNVRGLNTGIRTTEHGVYDNIEIIGCRYAFEIGENTHGIYFGYVDVEQCAAVFNVPSGGTAFGAIYGYLDVEQASVADGAWNSPLYLIAPGSISALTGALTIRIVGSPAGGLALGATGYNLDTALVFDSTAPSGDHGGISGWRSKHPSDSFVRLANLSLPAGNGGQCWPTLHPWRNISNTVTVAAGQLKGVSSGGNSRIVVPTLRGGITRRVAGTFTLGSSTFNVQVLANYISGGTNLGQLITWTATSGGSITLTVAGTVAGSVAGPAAGATTTLAVDVICGPDKVPAIVRAYQDGVLKVSYPVPASVAALLVPDTATYPYVEDGIGFGADTTSYATAFRVTDIPTALPILIGAKVTRAAALAIAASTFTDVQWDTDAWNTQAFHSTTTNPERITIPPGYGGYYLVQAEFGSSTSASSGRFYFRITVNGSDVPGGQSEDTGASGTYPSLNVSTLLKLAAGDIVRANMYQTSTGAVNADTTRCALAVTRIAEG